MSIDTAFTQFPSLTTERLRLRAVRPEDLKEFFAIRSDEEVMKYSGHPPLRSLDEAREQLEQARQSYTQREAIGWAITLKNDDTLIGICGFHHFRAEHRVAETGYELAQAHWRKGIMFEAMTAILSFGFTELNLHRVEAIIDIENIASKTLLEKLGFTYEGTLRERYDQEGELLDETYYGLLKREWLARNQA
uniref:Alanine acetyltransferase n=1 Tax=Thermosporothrix sp. COM3 TaxID=2490863 RepID=A0A455SKH8_9CHLR|nr:alanine acetyltransferase [Thermosporothrix sp. COM3]